MNLQRLKNVTALASKFTPTVKPKAHGCRLKRAARRLLIAPRSNRLRSLKKMIRICPRISTTKKTSKPKPKRVMAIGTGPETVRVPTLSANARVVVVVVAAAVKTDKMNRAAKAKRELTLKPKPAQAKPMRLVTLFSTLRLLMSRKQAHAAATVVVVVAVVGAALREAQTALNLKPVLLLSRQQMWSPKLNLLSQ